MIVLLVGSMGVFFNLGRHFFTSEMRPDFNGDGLLGLLCFAALGLPMLTLMLGRWVRRRVANPLAEIMEAAESVSQGDLSVRVNSTERGEFRRLTKSFNHMVAELQHSDQLRRSLTADVAHELNTPLHIIQGYLEGILDGVYQPDEETINTLLEETHLLTRLVEDLRTLSLAEGGQLPLVIEPVNLAELLADVQTSFSGQAEAAEIALQIEAAADLTLAADADRLDQILSNLVANALRYTPAGGQITLQAAAADAGISITVQDTGSGIDPEDLPLVFERFWRADKSRQHGDGSGQGLGLAIARQLVQAHGGRIAVASQLGQGTTFSIWLPTTPV